MRGGAYLLSSRSRPARRGCWLESLSEVPEKVARLAFPRPLEGSSRRRCLVVAEESLAEDSARSVRGGAAASRSVSRTHCPPPGGP